MNHVIWFGTKWVAWNQNDMAFFLIFKMQPKQSTSHDNRMSLHSNVTGHLTGTPYMDLKSNGSEQTDLWNMYLNKLSLHSSKYTQVSTVHPSLIFRYTNLILTNSENWVAHVRYVILSWNKQNVIETEHHLTLWPCLVCVFSVKCITRALCWWYYAKESGKWRKWRGWNNLCRHMCRLLCLTWQSNYILQAK